MVGAPASRQSATFTPDSALDLLVRPVGTTDDLVEDDAVVAFDFLEEYAVELLVGHPGFFDAGRFVRQLLDQGSKRPHAVD
jgi:hypothetical protein